MSISFNELYLAKNEDGHEMNDKLAARRFFFYLLMLGMVLGVAPLIKGGFFVDQHEGDMLHLIDITLRMANGEWPHIDFVTPLGSLAFMPFAVLVNAGMGVGAAFLWGQVFFAALVLPMIWWVGVSRLNLVQSYLLGGAVMITALALIYGNTDPYVSMSMHYNRWAWALAFIVVPVATLVPERRIPLADGVILGLAMAFFAFGKITYGVALAPGLVLALILTQQWRAMFFGIMTFFAIMAAITIAAGAAIWPAYLSDLQLVSTTDIRPRAGESWISLLFSPKFIVAHAILFAAIVLLRRSAFAKAGLILAVFAPGFVFICYQNYGNDPKWLAVLAVLLLSTKFDAKLKIIGLIAAVLIAPSFANMAFSPMRHAMQREAGFTAISSAPLHDIHTMTVRDTRIQTGQSLIFETTEFSSLNNLADRPTPPQINGKEFPSCLLQLGLLTAMRSIARDLEVAGFIEKKIFTADTFGSFWLFADLKRIKGVAPWYYGNLSGFDNADLVLVPRCAITPRAVKSVISDIENAGVELYQVRETELYTLYEKR